MRALGIAILAGLTMTGTVQAQSVVRMLPPGVVVASDLYGPDDDLPPPPRYAPPPYSRFYPAPPPLPPGPPPVYAPSAYGPGLPVHEIYRIVRNSGYSPLGAPVNRGNVITISVFDPDGEDGRLVIDAYSGRILRFVPAYSQSGRNPSAMPVAYSRPTVPLPKPRTAVNPPQKPTVTTASGPQIPPAPTAAVAAAAQPSPAAPPPAPKPVFAPQPTQAMPPVQGAE